MERFTKIVCTIGPPSSGYSAIRDMALLGMDVARLNFSHLTHAHHGRIIGNVRKAEAETGRRIMVLQDLPGPKIRVGELKGGTMRIRRGGRVTVRAGAREGASDSVIPVPYAALSACVSSGSEIYLADGSIRLRVAGKSGNDLSCVALDSGLLEDHKGVNVPGSTAAIPAITGEDERHMEFGARNGVDAVAISFVRSADDVLRASSILKRLGSRAIVVAKIEKREAVRRRRAIIRVADAVMVARGDLGVEIGQYEVPFAQKAIISDARRLGRPSITATQMLLSMVRSRVPTRAEVSDAANAILDGTSAVMLSEETAHGQNYREAVRVLDSVARRTERDPRYKRLHRVTQLRIPARKRWATL